MRSQIWFAFMLLLPLAGCADDGPLPNTGREEGRSPKAAPAPQASLAGATPAGAAPVGTASAPRPERSAQPAPPPPPPAELAAVLKGRPADARTLQAWAADAEATPQVRLAALRSLEARGQALDAAAALTRAKSPTLRANAVAVLARSDDPRAASLIAQLPTRYRQLARQLRQRAERKTP